MDNINRKIKFALFILMICLVAFIGFSNAGILFSASSDDIITVSTTKKTFEPKNYVASVAAINKVQEQITTTATTTTVTTTKVTTTKVTTTKVITTTSTTKQEITTTKANSWNGPVLTNSKGVVNGPSGKETYYNLNMAGVVRIMRNAGFSEEAYPYWVREDGVKMLGNYVMVAANFEIRPRGSIVQSSLGEAIVCDTGGFAKTNPTQLDIAVTW